MKESQRRTLKSALRTIEYVLEDIHEDGYELNLIQDSFDEREYEELGDAIGRDYDRVTVVQRALLSAIHLGEG